MFTWILSLETEKMKEKLIDAEGVKGTKEREREPDNAFLYIF